MYALAVDAYRRTEHSHASVRHDEDVNATQLEALVLQAVDAVKAGSSPEDDRIEFKREWPPADKARQLAATANQALGDHVIYVVGVDEKARTVHLLDDTDPADWWAQMESRFDEVAPDLVRHLGIQISDEERVVALLFHTDRAPYVVKVGMDGGGQLEVPIRAGTRTRSAKRHELIRLLYPTASVPRLTVVSARLEQSVDFDPGSEGRVLLWLDAQVLFEPAGSTPVFLPWHSSVASLDIGGKLVPGEVTPWMQKDGRPSDAIHVRKDGLRVSEPGVVDVRARWVFRFDRARRNRMVHRWTARITFAATGTGREAEVRMVLGNRRRATYSDPAGRTDLDLAEWRWTLEVPGSTP